MEKEFWQERWDTNNIGFHGSQANPLLIEYFDRLSLSKGKRVFVPLCGKTLDIHWLLENGSRVVGVELSEKAVGQLFDELGMQPTKSKQGPLEIYSAEGIDIFIGDIFDLTQESIGSVDAIYDRAALVALPSQMRVRYSNHLKDITRSAPQLLICFEYDQDKVSGPPFSVVPEEMRNLYEDSYDLHPLANKKVPGGLKGKAEAKECMWFLQTKSS